MQIAAGGPRVAHGGLFVARADNGEWREAASETASGEWARLGSNQRPLACEALARFAAGRHLSLIRRV